MLDGHPKEALRQLFLDHGFVRVGFTTAEPVRDDVSPWVASGAHAGLDWMEREPASRADPTRLLASARSVICVAAAYPRTPATSHVAGYACGEDYHRTLRSRLDDAVAALPALLGEPPATRVCVDTAPLLERAFAARAGLGWIGRNTMLLDETTGPWMLLAEVVTDLAIAPDAPAVDRCGSCTACVEACPTGALDGERHLDAHACLSYWTIEHRGPLAGGPAARLERWAFGCDDCLLACPFPRHEQDLPESGPFEARPDLAIANPDDLSRRSHESFRRNFGSTPLERARKGGLLRNLAALERADRSAPGDPGAGPQPRPAPGSV